MTALPHDRLLVASPRQLSTTLGDEVVILGLDDEIYYGLAGAGARTWELLQLPRTFDDLVEALLLEFEVTRERLAADLQDLLTQLNERGLVSLADPSGA